MSRGAVGAAVLTAPAREDGKRPERSARRPARPAVGRRSYPFESRTRRLHGHSGTANDRDHLADWPLLDEVFAPLDPQGHTHCQLCPVDLPRDGRLDFASLLGKGDDVTDLEPLDRELDGHPPDCSFGGAADRSERSD
jgi:hypothetical protein